jgi:Glycosyl hydrolases family 38 N-terminal domain
MGFDAWFFARIDYQDKESRLESQKMEMVMHPPQSSGIDSSIFTHVEYYHYEAPPGFNFDHGRSTEPIIDNKKNKAYNVNNRAR